MTIHVIQTILQISKVVIIYNYYFLHYYITTIFYIVYNMCNIITTMCNNNYYHAEILWVACIPIWYYEFNLNQKILVLYLKQYITLPLPLLLIETILYIRI